MEPCTGINKCWIPTLQHIVGISQALPQAVKGITYGQKVPLTSVSILAGKMNTEESLSVSIFAGKQV
jgi:hypothetical protein